MSDDLHALETWLAPLIERLSDPQRRSLALRIARELRQAQSATIASQRAPDGTPFEPRKRPHNRPDPRARRNARGQIRRASQGMFLQLRKPKHLRAIATPLEAVVQFAARRERIARVHHFGLRDAVQPGGPVYPYPARPLLGLTDDQRQRIRALALDHLRL